MLPLAIILQLLAVCGTSGNLNSENVTSQNLSLSQDQENISRPDLSRYTKVGNILSNPVILGEPMNVTCSVVEAGGPELRKILEKHILYSITMTRSLNLPSRSEQLLATYYTINHMFPRRFPPNIDADSFTREDGKKFETLHKMLNSSLKLTIQNVTSADLTRYHCTFTYLSLELPCCSLINKTFGQTARSGRDLKGVSLAYAGDDRELEDGGTVVSWVIASIGIIVIVATFVWYLACVKETKSSPNEEEEKAQASIMLLDEKYPLSERPVTL